MTRSGRGTFETRQGHLALWRRVALSKPSGSPTCDTVKVAVIPVLLGKGIPLLPPPAQHVKLRLAGNKAYQSGIVSLEYAIEYQRAEGTR